MDYVLIAILLTVIILLIFVIRKCCYSNEMINLDNNATTKPHKEVLTAMLLAADLGNASSFYAHDAKNILETLRCLILSSLMLDKKNYRCIITSGASESNNLILRGFNGPKIISAMEHKTSIECGEQLNAIFISGDPLDRDWISKIPRKTNSALLSVMAVNNETGNINPIFDIQRSLNPVMQFQDSNFSNIQNQLQFQNSKMIRQRNILIHTDIAQFYGKFDKNNREHVDLINSADCFSISFHKIYGPVGVGALILPRSIQLKPQITGTQNDGFRGGTENIMACAAESFY